MSSPDPLVLPVLLAAFLAPGYLVHRLQGEGSLTFLLSLSWSWSILIGTVVLSIWLSLSNGVTLVIYLAVVLILLLAVIAREKVFGARVPRRSGGVRRRVDINGAWLVMLVLVAGYQVFAGTYLELPADVYSHLDHMKEEYLEIAKDRQGEVVALREVVDRGSRHWYKAIGYLGYFLSRPIGQLQESLALVNVMMLASAVYFFALFLFANLKWSRPYKIALAMASVAFFFVCFGVNIFAYIRYYALAPAISAFAVHIAVVALFVALLRDRCFRWKHVVSGLALSAVVALIHMQEAGFILVTVLSMSMVFVWMSVRECGWTGLIASGRGRLVLLFLSAALIVVVLATLTIDGRPIIGNMNRPLLKPVADLLPFVKGMRIANPTYQFYQVLALWGCLVLAAFLVYRRRFSGNYYILGAMAAPLLTLFNPLFVEIYIRYQPVETLWRFSFIMPLAFVGGFVLVDRGRHVLSGAPLRSRSAAALVMVLLVLSVLPVDATYLHNRYSRLSTLLPVPSGNDHRHWNDLIEYLRQQGGRQAITDPVTGYMVSGLTDFDSKNYKFHGYDGVRLDGEDYTRRDFREFQNWALIVNLRDGDLSRNGRLSGHWSPHTLEVSRHYSEEFLQFVEDHPRIFEKDWEQDRVAVYRIR